jgi:lycopene cyclase domain-containing protein
VSYTLLALSSVGGGVVLDLALLRTRLVFRRAFWVSYAIMFGFQLLVNGVLTGVPIVRYSSGTILGARLAYAPVEDLAFGFALILTTLSCWVTLNRRRATVRSQC